MRVCHFALQNGFCVAAASWAHVCAPSGQPLKFTEGETTIVMLVCGVTHFHQAKAKNIAWINVSDIINYNLGFWK